MFVFSATKVVVCDDVRLERNGKFILIGVYTDNTIGIIGFPTQVRFSCYVETLTAKSGTHTGEFRILDHRAEAQASGALRIVAFPNVVFPVHFLNLSFPTGETGSFKLQWRFGDSGWEDVTTIRVILPPPDDPLPDPIPPS